MSRLGEALLETDDPPVAALVVFDANPAASNPDLTRVHAGLAREDLFTVVLEQRLTDTALYADIVLPATMQPEHLDIHNSYGHHYVTLNLPASGRRANACRTARSSAASRRHSGSTIRACASPTSRSRATCSTARLRTRRASRSSACATRARCA